jgi:alanine dehydrogenase
MAWFTTANATTPFALQIAEHGLAAAVAKSKPLSLGLNTYDGHVTYRAVAEALGYPYKPLHEAMKR